MNKYKALKNKQEFTSGNYAIVPIRFEDRYNIMQWRNEQIYHLRQERPLTKEDQDNYFNTVVAKLFGQEKPSQILFSFLKNGECIGYGGLVHINWTDKNAEISFIMDTAQEKDYFELHWSNFLRLIEEVANSDLNLHKIYTYAFDLRPKLYHILKKESFVMEATLKQHACFQGSYIDVVIHSKLLAPLLLRNAELLDTELTYKWATNLIVREHAFNKEKIEWECHRQWFADKISDTNCEYYIFVQKATCLGSIRFDIDQKGNALISYLIDPQHHGKGYGEIILVKGIERLKSKRSEVKSVYGFVQHKNLASIRIFEKLNFQTNQENPSLFRFEKQI